MSTTIQAEINLTVEEPAELVFAVAAASGPEVLSERLQCMVDGAPVPVQETAGPVGARLHMVQAPLGWLTFSYEAVVAGSASAGVPTTGDQILYRRPSRFVESDRLAVIAQKRFAHLFSHPSGPAALARIQEIADRNIRRYGLAEEER